MMQPTLQRIASPLGLTLLVQDERRRVRSLVFNNESAWQARLLAHYPGLRWQAAGPDAISARLRDYFNGDPQQLELIPISPRGTVFQHHAWQALRRLPAGHTRTDGQLANALSKSRNARAVGLANAVNPIALIVSCHRLTGTDGKLRGDAWSLARKQWLLAHKQRRPNRCHQPINRHCKGRSQESAACTPP